MDTMTAARDEVASTLTPEEVTDVLTGIAPEDVANAPSVPIAVPANDLEMSGVTVDAAADIEDVSDEELMFDSIVSSACADGMSQSASGPNCLVIYRLDLPSDQFTVGPNGEIYSNGI